MYIASEYEVTKADLLVLSLISNCARNSSAGFHRVPPGSAKLSWALPDYAVFRRVPPGPSGSEMQRCFGGRSPIRR
eukprot:15466765-Alexandrium_andersonii.AAC.1